MEKKQTNSLTVRCPKCGHEYHLCEIAVPGELLGTPNKHGIVKDPLGKIIVIDWDEEPTTTIEYCCDNCGKEFLVDVNINLKVREKPEAEDFSTLETSLL